MNDLVYLDGFSGYGGFHLALEQAGFKFKKVYFSEMDKHAIANYKYNYPNSIYAGLIQHIDRTTIPEGIDLFTFGWPCQDNSIAGKRKGQSGGTRSGLLSEAVRIINEFKPRHFIAENVPGLLSVNEGIDYIEAIKLLCVFNESCPQYDIEMQLCNTKWFLPQNRERLFFVGHLRGTGSRKIFPVGSDTESPNGLQGQGISSNTLTARYAGATSGGAYIIEDKQFQISAQRGRKNGQELELSKGDYSNTLTSVQKDNLVITANTAKGFEEVSEGDSINFSVPNSKTRRGRVGKGVAQTLDTACNQGIIAHYGHKDKEPTHHDICPTLKAQSHGHEPMVVDYSPMQWVRSEKGKESRKESMKNGIDKTPFSDGNRELVLSEKDHIGTITSSAINKDSLIGNEKKIRRLTEIECERLQGLPDNDKCCIFTVWKNHYIEPQKNHVNAGIKNLRLLKFVGSAEKTNSKENVLFVKNHFNTNLPQTKKPAQQSVHIYCEGEKVEIRNQQGELLLFVNIAEKKESAAYPNLTADFVLQLVSINIIADQIARNGEVDYPQKESFQIQVKNGNTHVNLFGNEITQPVNFAQQDIPTIKKHTKSTTSSLLEKKNLDTQFQTLFYSVMGAIRSFIPEEILSADSLTVEIKTKQGWTKHGNYDGEIKEISSTQRYKLCGNGVSVPIVKMIAEKLFKLNYTTQ